MIRFRIILRFHQYFRNCKKSDKGDNKIHPAQQIDIVKRKALCAAYIVHSHCRYENSYTSADKTFKNTFVRYARNNGKTEYRQRQIFGRPEQKRYLGYLRSRKQQYESAYQAAYGRSINGHGQSFIGFALLRHRITVEQGCGIRRCSRRID